MLPATLAIFDDQIVDRDHPKTLHRYALARVHHCGRAITLSPITASSQEAELIVNTAHIRYPGRYEVCAYPGTMKRVTNIWTTGDSIQIGDEVYPLVDMDHRILLSWWPYSIKRAGDTLYECRTRQADQSSMRLRFIKESITCLTPAPSVAPVPDIPPLVIPTFVGRLVKENAIKSGDSCGISKIPFELDVPATMLPCFHLFDPESLHAWLQIKKECPLCKHPATGQTLV